MNYSQHEYDYSSGDISPPAYDLLPEYSSKPLFGMSQLADGQMVGRASYCCLNSCEHVYHFAKIARRHRSKITPRWTIQTIKSPGFQLQIAAMSLPAAIIHDVITTPYHFTKMMIAISRSKYEKKKAEAGILDEIIENLWLSVEVVLRMVTRLGLETHEAVEQQVYNGKGFLYVTLARLLEAYGSRFAPSGTVYLISHKRLPKAHCSGTARRHFDQIHELKEALISTTLFPAYNLENASVALEGWIRRVFPALKEQLQDPIEDPGFSYVIQKLIHIQDEMPRLIPMDTGK